MKPFKTTDLKIEDATLRISAERNGGFFLNVINPNLPSNNVEIFSKEAMVDLAISILESTVPGFERPYQAKYKVGDIIKLNDTDRRGFSLTRGKDVFLKVKEVPEDVGSGYKLIDDKGAEFRHTYNQMGIDKYSEKVTWGNQ